MTSIILKLLVNIFFCYFHYTDTGCSPISVKECDSLLPYNSTRIPNNLLHDKTKSRKHINMVYHQIMNAANDNMGKQRLFACALTFPECPDAIGKYRVPCRRLCREVLADIGNHVHVRVRCEDLPDEGDRLCIRTPAAPEE